MKKSALYLVAFLMTAFIGSAIAQDDVYYDPSDDYYQDTYTADASEAIADEDTYYREDNNTCGYSYTSRVRRFRSSYRGFSYYDPCYTDSYYYGATPGTNVYVTFGSPYSYYNSYRPGRWTTWSYNPYSAYNPYYAGYNNPYSYNYGNSYGYGGYGNSYGYNGYNSYGGYNNAYCPPTAYGGYYASSTPGNSSYATPRPNRPTNYSTGNPTTGNTGVRPGTTTQNSGTSIFNTQSGTQAGETNPRPGKDVVLPVNKPDHKPATRPATTTRTKPATTTRTRPATTTRSKKPTRTIFKPSPRSNSSSKPSYTPKRSTSKPSYRPSSSSRSSKSSASPSRSNSSSKSSSRSSSSSRRGGN